MPKSITNRAVWWVGGAALLVAVVLLFDLYIPIRGGRSWMWGYQPLPLLPSLAIVLMVLVYSVGAWWVLHHSRRAVWSQLWAALGIIVMSYGVVVARDGTLLYAMFTRTVEIASGAEHFVAVSVNWGGGEWRTWTDVMERLGDATVNVTTMPPGFPALFHWTGRAFETIPTLNNASYRLLQPLQCHALGLVALPARDWNAAWLGMLMPLFAAATVFPLVGVARRFVDDNGARMAVLWYALVPSVIAFNPSTSVMFPLIGVVVMAWLLRGTQTPDGLYRLRPLWLLAAGALWGAGMYLNFVYIPLATLYGGYALVWAYHQHRRNWLLQAMLIGLWFGIGGVLAWAPYTLVTGQTLLDLFTHALGDHNRLDFPYFYGIRYHLWDWVLFAGVAFVLLTCVTAWLGLRQREPHRPPLMSYALVIAVLIWNFTNVSRGETARVWLVLNPFLMIAAAEGLARVRDERLAWNWLTAAHGAVAAVIWITLSTYATPYLTPPPARPSAPNVSYAPLDSAFAGTSTDYFRLTGWHATADDTAITLDLQWQGINAPQHPHWFGMILVAPDGNTYTVEPTEISNNDGRAYPTTCWGDGTIYARYTAPLPENPLAGDWYISLSVYGEPDTPDTRLRVTHFDGSVDGQIGLGPVGIGGASDR